MLFLNRYSYIEIGEKDQQNPLRRDKISPASYETFINEDKFSTIIQK